MFVAPYAELLEFRDLYFGGVYLCVGCERTGVRLILIPALKAFRPHPPFHGGPRVSRKTIRSLRTPIVSSSSEYSSRRNAGFSANFFVKFKRFLRLFSA